MDLTDPDLIAVVYPVPHKNNIASHVLEVAATLGTPGDSPSPAHHSPGPEHQRRRDERENTPVEDPSNNTAEPTPRLEVRFSKPPRTSQGFLFGADPDSDIVISDALANVSYHHVAMTFDAHRRLVLKDLNSANGTEVTYDTHGEGIRRGFVWIIGGDRNILSAKTNIIVGVGLRVKFRLVVPVHDITSQAYIDNVSKYLRGAAGPDTLVKKLKIRSRPITALGSGHQTPGQGPIAIKLRLGEGAFGVVSRVWDVSIGHAYALKEPSEKAIRTGMVNFAAWQQEAENLSRISHDHVVRLLDSDFTGFPQLSLEYMPLGSLENFPFLLNAQCSSILVQLLSALEYMHGLSPPILHRDIKPANILVESYDVAGNLRVKFGDFGLSRQTQDPTTLCGTPRYLAPEVYDTTLRGATAKDQQSYTAAVDIWSLGVVILGLLWGGLHPNPQLPWCEGIVKKVADELETNLEPIRLFVASFMVPLNPAARASASTCYVVARQVFGDSINQGGIDLAAFACPDPEQQVPLANENRPPQTPGKRHKAPSSSEDDPPTKRQDTRQTRDSALSTLTALLRPYLGGSIFGAAVPGTTGPPSGGQNATQNPRGVSYFAELLHPIPAAEDQTVIGRGPELRAGQDDPFCGAEGGLTSILDAALKAEPMDSSE